MKFLDIAPWVILTLALLVPLICVSMGFHKRAKKEREAEAWDRLRDFTLKKKYPDAPDPEDVEAFTYWLCGQIDRDFDYNTNDFDNLGPNGEDGKKKMNEMVLKGYITNIEDYDELCRNRKELDLKTVNDTLRKKAIERYEQDKFDAMRPVL